MAVVDVADAVLLQTEDPAVDLPLLHTAEVEPGGLVPAPLLGQPVPGLVPRPGLRVPPYVQGQLLREHQRGQRESNWVVSSKWFSYKLVAYMLIAYIKSLV